MRSRSSTSTRPLLLGGAAVLAVAVVVALLGGDGPAPPGLDLDAEPLPSITGTAVPTGATGVPAPVVVAPALLSEGDNAVPVTGEGTMIVFLAHWCQYCNAEVPVVTRWLAEVGLPEGTELRTVATAVDPARPHFPPDQWLRERGWTVPTLLDTDGSIAAAYGVDSYPYWVFVDADGVVRGAGGSQSGEDLTRIATALAAG